MNDAIRGRNLALMSLGIILILTVGLSILAGSTPAVRYGRPLIVALSCLLVWQGRLWARWLLVFFGLGILLGGLIALGNGLPPWTIGGAVIWIAALAYAWGLLVIFGSTDARAFFTSASVARAPAHKAGA